MKVYVITSGCYSEYHIDAVFDDYEKAKIYVAAHDSINDPVFIETYDTDNTIIESNGKPIGCIVYYVAFRKHDIENPRLIDYHKSWVIDPDFDTFDIRVSPDWCANTCYVTVLTTAGIDNQKKVFEDVKPKIIEACKSLMEAGALRP